MLLYTAAEGGILMDSFEEIWELVREELKNEFSEAVYNLWLKELKLVSFEGSSVVLSIVEFKRKIIQRKFFDSLCSAFEKVLGFKIDVILVEPDTETAEKGSPANDSSFGGNSASLTPYSANTFETFVVGSSNKFAHAAAQAVAANPGKAYNPLFIYGNSGLGKTHLLSAIAHEIQLNNPDVNIIFTHGEAFTNELVSHLAQKDMAAFHNKYRNADVLLVDDVQFIAGRESTQEEFFHTFNELTRRENQIVLTSDRPPKEITTLEDRLRTRFEWGLIADVQPPDIETRMAIVKRKAQLLNLDISDEVVQYIASKLKNNIRQLEGAVKKMQAFINLHSAQMNIATAQNAIRDILNESEPVTVTCERIIEEVARTYGVDPSEIRSRKRDASTAQVRRVAIYVISEMTGLSTKSIGEEFQRDHSTVIYSLSEIKKEIAKNSSLKATISDIIKNVEKLKS